MKPEPISVWEPQEIHGELVFVRPAPGPLGDHYAAVRELRPKKAELPLRVCLFGESVAAGYLYAPHLTLAKVLESHLQTIGGADRFEVIDLARTNETLASLAETVRTSLQINPDVLVIFVGNNWNLLETPELSPYAPTNKEPDIRRLVEQAREQLTARVEHTFEIIATLARAVGIPVVLVIPEVNLADWENRQPPLGLSNEAATRWFDLYDRAIEHLEAGDFADALTVAGEMKSLDSASCPTTWRIEAKAHQGLGDPQKAQETAIAEIDCTDYPTLTFLGAPQARSFDRALLTETAIRHHFIAIDLRDIFRAYTRSPLPGRRLFLDYCHLTSEGMHVAMAAVAAQVLDLSGMVDDSPSWHALLQRLDSPKISPAAEALARFGAAIHTAHRLLTVGPKRPLLEHWCEAALDADSGIAEAMFDFIDIRTALPCPAVLTAAYGRNYRSPYRLLLQHGLRWDYLDAELIEAIVAVLDRRGHNVRESVNRLLVERLGLGDQPVDLTEPPYLWEPLEQPFPDVMSFDDLPRRAVLRCAWQC